MLISVIVCSVAPQKTRAITDHYGELLRGEPHEFVLIDDARSMCDGYNRGVARSTGDYLLFSHDDVEILSEDFAPRLLAHLTTHDLVGFAGTSLLIHPSFIAARRPYIHGVIAHPRLDGPGYELSLFGPPTGRAQAFDGLLFAARRSVLEKISFDAETFDGWHLYDLDFSYRAWQAGFRIAIPLDILVLHQSHGNFGAEREKYAARFLDKFGPPITRKTNEGSGREVFYASNRSELLSQYRSLYVP